jgi:hypothetical protein
MKQEHHPKDRKSYHRGAKPDLDPRTLGDVENTNGNYYDAVNMRQSSGDDGAYSSLVPVRSWENIDDGRPFSVDREYRCIGAFSVNDHLVEFWVHVTDVSLNTLSNSSQKPPIIIVDGTLVAKSYELGFKADKPLQGDVNESCVGGEVYVTDDNTEPKIFNVKDLLDSVGTEKYFSAYEPGLNSINLRRPADIPVFVELVNAGGGGGLPVGSYRYSIRYVDDAGNRTNWSPFTPLIEVPRRQGNNSSIFPATTTYGDDPDPTSSTSFAPKIRFRVTNLFDYDSIEIKREAWNAGAGIYFKPQGEIIYRSEVSEQEISVRTFVDPEDGNMNEPVSGDDTETTRFVRRAKAIRYFNRRLHLANIVTQEKSASSDVGFEGFASGAEVIPKMEKLGVRGYNDPWTRAYRSRFMSGEKYSFAITLYDSVGGKSFANEFVSNYQMPNRRDRVSSEGQLYSYNTDGVDAVATDRGIGNTFEIFDMEDSVAKTDLCSFKNVFDPDSGTLNATGRKSESEVNKYCSQDYPDSWKNLAGVGPPYKPFYPNTTQNDDVSGLNYIVNTKVYDGSQEIEYRPEGFGPNYYSQGLALKGVNNLPSWAQAFSIDRSEPAGRVVAQGFGVYRAKRDERTSKFLDALHVSLPDIEGGYVDSDLLVEMKNNPKDFSIQFVSPLGFFSEVYNFDKVSDPFINDAQFDVISYPHIIKDRVGIQKFNPVDNIGVKSGSEMYVDFGQWRNNSRNPLFDTADKGNLSLTINSVDDDASTPHFVIYLNSDIYMRSSGSEGDDFNTTSNREFHEPWYGVNIIREGAQVEDRQVDKFKPTGTYQKIESIIGESNGSPDQSFRLVDERWEDCIPALDPSHPLASENRYVYVEDVSGVKKAWVCVSFKNSSEKNTIQSDISNNGYWVSPDGTKVYGMYEHSNTDDRFFTIDFVHEVPSETARIYVRYDDRVPISVYGGRVVTSYHTMGVLDTEVTGDDLGSTSSSESGFLGVVWTGVPFSEFELNPRYYQIKRDSGVGNFIQDASWGKIGYIRQWVVPFLCESYAPQHLRWDDEPAYSTRGGTFPLTNYVIRPHRASDPLKNLYGQYDTDYPNEKRFIYYGGFRYGRYASTNPDYAVKPYYQLFSKPDEGFEQENDFCTAIVWSLPRPINVQDSPGLKTFLATNIFYLSDDQGEIKFLYDTMTEKGRNLFAVTERGVCMLLVNKSVLSDINSDELAYIRNDNYMSDEYWLTKNIGCRGQFWQGRAEGRIRIPQEGSNKHTEVLMWPDVNGVYQMVGTSIQEVTRGKYSSKILPELENAFYDEGFINTPLEAVIDESNNEYWLHIIREAGYGPFVELDEELSEGPILSGVLQAYGGTDGLHVFNMDTNEWTGRFMYSFDEYVYHNNSVVGLRETTAYWLDRGDVMACHVEQISSGKTDTEHEFVRLQVNTDHLHGSDDGKPSRILFIDEGGNVMCEVSQVEQGQYYVKRYDGWEAFIPRVSGQYSTRRERIQGDYTRYRIEWDEPIDLVLRSTNVQFKDLK